MLNIGLTGANGKMGQAVANKLNLAPTEYNLLKFTRNSSIDELDYICEKADVVIDFSSPKLLSTLLKYAIKYNTPLVIGTSGFNKTDLSSIKQASKDIPILHSANMSIGANLLALLVEKATTFLGEEYDTEIIEYHHKHKIDAPSATSLMLAWVISKAKNIVLEDHIVLDRHTRHEPRKSNQIGISSVRGGNIYGTNEILFAGNNEVINIQHHALNRECFIDGAIIAAKWIIKKQSGLFSMLDVYTSDK